jgi:DNA-binding IclR family transcriptional regulator
MDRTVGEPTDGVKSANRVLALLELFRHWRRPASAREIAEALAMPRSSTTVLLRSMIQGGYLRVESDLNLYFPTLRVFQLGSWMGDGFLADAALTTLLEKIAAATDETVCAWVRQGFSARVFQVIPSTQPIALSIEEGATAPLFGSAVGSAFLGLLDDKALEALIDLHNRAPLAGRRAVRDVVLADVAGVRERGVSIGYHRWLADAGAVAAPLCDAVYGEPLVVAVGGPVFRIERNEARIEDALLSSLAGFGRIPNANP